MRQKGVPGVQIGIHVEKSNPSMISTHLAVVYPYKCLFPHTRECSFLSNSIVVHFFHTKLQDAHVRELS